MNIRLAREDDAEGIREVIRSTYGDKYPYGQFYDLDVLRRMILTEDTLVLVAEDEADDRIVATAAVLLEAGAYADLVGEFARLAVLPDHRRQGIGGALMAERLRRVEDRLHVGFVDARVTHPYSLAIAQKSGFVPVGFFPLKDQFATRESTALLARWFGDALELRRNNPRIIPEVHPLASLCLQNAGRRVDAVVDDASPPHPHDEDFEIERLDTEAYSSLLRIERGRTRHREVFGPMRLHYGVFRLRARDAEYLIARRGGRIAGALGLLRDDVEKMVRVFELITPDDTAIRFLFAEAERRCRQEWGAAYLDVDVSADAPRLQRTLLELGFVPAAYVPAMAFHDVERLDLVRMMRLLVPLELGEVRLTPEVQAVADLVLGPLTDQQVLPDLTDFVDESSLFRGLTAEQAARIAAISEVRSHARGVPILREGGPGDALFLVLDGDAEIRLAGASEPVGVVGRGEVLGEMGLLTDAAHGATAVARTEVRTARIACSALTGLVRRRPDIGVVVYRNLGAGLGRKLERADTQPRS